MILFLIDFLMSCILLVLSTGNSCVTKDNCLLSVLMDNKCMLVLLLLVFYPCYARASRRCRCQAGPKSMTATPNGLNQRAVENLRPLF